MPKKRADGRYCSQIYIGRDEQGRKQYKTVYAKSPALLKEKETEVRRLLGVGLDVLSQRDSFRPVSYTHLASGFGSSLYLLSLFAALLHRGPHTISRKKAGTSPGLTLLCIVCLFPLYFGPPVVGSAFLPAAIKNPLTFGGCRGKLKM